MIVTGQSIDVTYGITLNNPDVYTYLLYYILVGIGLLIGVILGLIFIFNSRSK